MRWLSLLAIFNAVLIACFPPAPLAVFGLVLALIGIVCKYVGRRR